MTQEYDFLQDAEQREDEWRDILVEIYTNRIYQQVRRSILEWRESVVKVISLVLASSAFITLKTNAAQILCEKISTAGAVAVPANGGMSLHEIFFSIFMLGIVAINSCSLVFQWSAKARDASMRFDAWGKMEEEINRVGLADFQMKEYKEWKGRMSAITSGEPIPNMKIIAWAERRARHMLQHGTSGTEPLRGDELEKKWPIFVTLN